MIKIVASAAKVFYIEYVFLPQQSVGFIIIIFGLIRNKLILGDIHVCCAVASNVKNMCNIDFRIFFIWEVENFLFE